MGIFPLIMGIFPLIMGIFHGKLLKNQRIFHGYSRECQVASWSVKSCRPASRRRCKTSRGRSWAKRNAGGRRLIHDPKDYFYGKTQQNPWNFWHKYFEKPKTHGNVWKCRCYEPKVGFSFGWHGFATLKFHMESFRTGHMKRENDLAKVQFFGLSSGESSAEVLESHCRYPIPSYDSSWFSHVFSNNKADVLGYPVSSFLLTNPSWLLKSLVCC